MIADTCEPSVMFTIHQSASPKMPVIDFSPHGCWIEQKYMKFMEIYPCGLLPNQVPLRQYPGRVYIVYDLYITKMHLPKQSV